MNSRHQRTLQAIFANPISRNIEWRHIERLFIALGCDIIEGHGSRVAFKHGTLRADFHRPHPAKEAKSYQIRAAREFLVKLGIQP
ncbi:MAG: type II toxin-antitoxin system HicA family toxin [Candidatus Latescibacterota bacterium]|jgi:hypothetical protein